MRISRIPHAIGKMAWRVSGLLFSRGSLTRRAPDVETDERLEESPMCGRDLVNPVGREPRGREVWPRLRGRIGPVGTVASLDHRIRVTRQLGTQSPMRASRFNGGARM